MTKLTLETERLLLRPLVLSDLEEVYSYSSDYEVAKYMYALSFNKDEIPPKEITADFLKLCEDEWQKEVQDFYEFAIMEKASGRQIGHIALYHLEEDNNGGEFGWILSREFWGKGYCTEAATELKRFAFETLHLTKIQAHCDEKNITSSRVMEKIGMKKVWGNGPRVYPNTGVESTEEMYIIKCGEKHE